jgi:hypothetical protein
VPKDPPPRPGADSPTGSEYFSLYSLGPGGEGWVTFGVFMLSFAFLARLPLFLTQLDIPTYHVLSSMMMGGGKMGAGTFIQPAQRKKNFL